MNSSVDALGIQWYKAFYVMAHYTVEEAGAVNRTRRMNLESLAQVYMSFCQEGQQRRCDTFHHWRIAWSPNPYLNKLGAKEIYLSSCIAHRCRKTGSRHILAGSSRSGNQGGINNASFIFILFGNTSFVIRITKGKRPARLYTLFSFFIRSFFSCQWRSLPPFPIFIILSFTSAH